MHLAVGNNSPNVVDLLLEANDLYINTADEFIVLPLILACEK